jgi:hypothetical protein
MADTGNTFMDTDQADAGPSPADAAKILRQAAVGLIGKMKRFHDLAIEQVNKHTRAAIATELGADAGKMLTFFNNTKAFIQNNAPSVPTDDLPA